MRSGKQRLVIILSTPTGGGALSAVRRLGPLLHDSGYAVTVLTNIQHHTHFEESPIDLLASPTVRRASLTRLTDLVLSAPSILLMVHRVRRLAKHNPDLIFLPFLTGSSLVVLTATLGLPNIVIVCERNDPSRQFHGWYVRLLQYLLYPVATAITVNSARPEAHRWLTRVSRGRPVFVVSNPRPTGMLPADTHTSRVILSVGRLVEQKRHAITIKAFAQVNTRISDWELCIVGGGPLHAELSHLIDRLDLRDRVKLVGDVQDIRRYFASSALFVLVSDYEGTSNALLEAASAGLPCIVSEESAPPGTTNALIAVPAGSIDRLADQILEVCSDATLRKRLGTHANEWVNLLTPADVVATWETAIRSTMDTE